MVRMLEKKNDLKKKKKLSKDDETKEECYRFADAWIVLEEEWKELNKKWDDIYFNSEKKKKRKKKTLFQPKDSRSNNQIIIV